jgi:hypothetical protein
VLLYLLGTSPTAPINLIVHYSTQPYLFSEVTVRHEYSLLLKNRFRVLNVEQQNVVLKMIENGPDRLSYERAITDFNFAAPSKEEVETYVGSWKLDWLSFIAEDLRADWATKYEELKKELPPSLNPEFPHSMHSDFGLVARSPNAPLSPPDDANGEATSGALDRLLRLGSGGSEPIVADLDRFLKELQTLAEASPQLILERIDEIAALPPRYLAPIAKALANRTVAVDARFMVPMLRLGVTAAQSTGKAQDLEEREKIRNYLAGILDIFFQDESQSLEAEHLQRFSEMAESLLSTVSLVSGQQAYGDSEDFDPLFWAINSVDGRIVENAIKIALRERKLQGEIDRVEPQWLLKALSHLLATMPFDEVRITAILGYRFPWLAHLSKSWATKNAEAIFPLSSEFRWRWEAAWCTYVGFSGAYNDVLEILINQYAKAVNEVSTKHTFKKSRLNPDQGLAQHLAVYYWRQLITLQHPLLIDFLTLGGEKPVKSFISHIGQGMRNVEGIPLKVTDSLRVLAEWMVSAWRPRRNNTKKALSAFGWWFPHTFLGDANWRLRLLRGAVKKAGNLDNIDQVLTDLDQLASEESTLVIDCLKGLTNGGHKDTSAYFLANHSVRILEKAAIGATTSTKAKISDIADYFGSKGHFEYRRFAQAPID